jgi:glutathionylspermidine synthase
VKVRGKSSHDLRKVWNSEPPALYGWLDLAYDGYPIKLLESNADAPTGLAQFVRGCLDVPGFCWVARE